MIVGAGQKKFALMCDPVLASSPFVLEAKGGLDRIALLLFQKVKVIVGPRSWSVLRTEEEEKCLWNKEWNKKKTVNKMR